MMNENRIIETLKYISKFVENRHDEGLGDYLHIVIGRTDINVIDETIYLLERKQKEIDRLKKEIEEKSTILLAGAEKVKQLEKEIEELKKPKYLAHFENNKITKMELINDFNFISKDKIREKIEGLKEIADEDNPDIYIKIDCYEELLEENDE